MTVHCRLPQKYLGRIQDASVVIRDMRAVDGGDNAETQGEADAPQAPSATSSSDPPVEEVA